MYPVYLSLGIQRKIMKAIELNEILNEPKKEISNFTDLVYINDDMLTIKRHKKGKGFCYTRKGKKITNPSRIERFKSLVIPPAWKDVRITHIKNGHLQAVGLDSKERKVYKYHDDWIEFRNQTKFLKMSVFGKKIPEIRKQVEKDLKLPRLSRDKVLALVIKIMEETHIRIGNQYYADENKSYGLSTFRSKHLKNAREKITFSFQGKKGKNHEVTLEDKKLIDLVNQCEEIPGWELFRYYEENKDVRSIDSTMVNNYIQNISGELFTAKDFRTWSATKIYFETLNNLGYTEKTSENKKKRIKALDTTAEALGNTRSVCEKYYVHPNITTCYEDGDIQKYFKKLDSNRFKKSKYFSKTEKVMLQMIKDFEPGAEE